MYPVLFLILFPFAAALVLAFVKNSKVRSIIVYLCGAAIMVAAVFFAIGILTGGNTLHYIGEAHAVDTLMLAGEFLLMALIVFLSFRHKRYFAALLSVIQTAVIAVVDLAGPKSGAYHLLSDGLTAIMVLIIGIVGVLICIYGVGYMEDYHHHHTGFKDRRPFFFAMLFLFLGAMFGLVLSNNLVWLYFFWEITSVASFLLIGYTRTEEAVGNSFRALWMNLLGGLGFAAGIAYAVFVQGIDSLDALVGSGSAAAVLPVSLIAFACLTKSAQLPFSKWLLGAMVAPTPTSALLHSATMVKAGVYLLLRLAPAMAGNAAGLMVSLVGGLTFLAGSMFAITRADGKQVLAWSTISNLGLITACAGVGLPESVWAGIFLIVFHAVSKSVLFQSVGAVENATGSRDIDDMHGLIVRYPAMAFVMIVGIAGMFLAPFGMLVAKWAALKAFIDGGNLLLVFFLAFGSATTLFYWAKWLGQLVAIPSGARRVQNRTHLFQWVSLWAHLCLIVLLCLCFPLLSTGLVTPLVSAMFGGATPVLAQGNLIVMVILLVFVFVVPLILWLLGRSKKYAHSLVYMGGANEGDDLEFVNSFGGNTSVTLSAWYLEDTFGEQLFWKPAVIISISAIILFLAQATGGAL